MPVPIKRSFVVHFKKYPNLMHWELSLCGNYPHIDLDHHKEMLQDLNIKGI